MALEPCRECGNMVSTEAKSCPRCGVPNPTAASFAAAAPRAEETVYEAHVHPIIYFWPFLGTVAAILILALLHVPKQAGWVIGGLSVLAWVVAFVIASSVDFVVTNRRVTTRTGILHKNSQETLLEKVETVGIHQDLLGRILNYGTVTVVGTGGSHDVFRRISRPMKLRRMLHDQIDMRKGSEVRT